jgi:DNA-damage-inducible protein J
MKLAKTATVRARVEPSLKRDAEAVLHKVGLTSSEAITLFLTQVKLSQGLPFEVNVPNSTTRRAISEARKRKNLETFDSVANWAESARKT